VVVVPRDPAEPFDLQAASKAIDHASSMLRREVASAITRKETPKLTFVVLPARAEKVDE
jgi:ribosome-binding factor A